ncbi:MAG: hypothetical protein AAF560_24445, partial [Acidobacteriota bacterium]
QQRVADLEENLTAIAALLGTEPELARANPAGLLEKLASRLMRVDRGWSGTALSAAAFATS